MCDKKKNECNVIPIKHSNMSSKMLRAKMIQNRKSFYYNNSNENTIREIINNNDYANCRKLLFNVGISIYKRHLDDLLNSCFVIERQLLMETFNIMILSLTIEEQKILGIYEKTENDLNIEELLYIDVLLNNPERIYYCCTIVVGDFKKLIIKNYKNELFIPGKTYIFNLEDSSNDGILLSLSDRLYTFKDSNFIFRIGTAGTAESYLVYIPSRYNETFNVYFFNKNDNTTNSYISFTQYYQKISLNLTNRSLNRKLNNVSVILNSSSKLHRTQDYSFLHYMFTELETYNNSAANFDWNYKNKIDYKLNYGTYHINTSKYITILNKNIEHLIDISGSTSTSVTLTNLTKDSSIDGDYNFFTGDLYIKVIDNFDKCSLYIKDEGYCNLYDSLVFDDTIIIEGYYKDYLDLSLNNMICLYPESKIHFHDISDIVSKDGDFITSDISYQPYITLNNNNETILRNEWIVYGLYKGKYVIKDISENHYIAFINNGKEDCFKYSGNINESKVGVGPDNNLYTFYTNYVIIEVYGNFGTMSVYDFYHGYCGGKNLLIYDDTLCIDISYEFQNWYNIVNDSSLFNADCSNIIIEDYDVSFLNVYNVNSYINIDSSINTTSIVNSNIYFDNVTDSTTKYSFYNGTYVLLNVPSSTPIAIINNGKEEFITYDGYFPYRTTEIGPDGNYYYFYYGNINIYIYGNFGRVSFYVGGNIANYLNGKNKLVYDESSNNGTALSIYSPFSNDPIVETDLEETVPLTFNISINIKKITYTSGLPYCEFVFLGYDRNGEIDDSITFPDLTFKLGDIVIFNFEYDNSDENNPKFGIYYINELIVNDNIIINDNNNNSNSTITWIPIYTGNSFTYKVNNGYIPYNSGNFIIDDNPSADIIIPDISYVKIYDSIDNEITVFDGVTTDIKKIEIYFEQNVYLNESGGPYYIYIKDTINNTIFKQIKNNDSSISITDNILTYNSNFGNSERLDFDTSYNISIDENFIRNIYYNGLNESVVDSSFVIQFNTEEAHMPILTSIEPSDNVLIDKYDFITLTFSEDVLLSGTIDDINYTNLLTNSVTQSTNIEVSNNLVFVYNSNMEYDSSYNITIPNSLIVDLSNIEFDDSDNLIDSFIIQTIIDPRPQLYYTYPENSQTDFYIDSTINLIFNENVFIDVSYNDNSNYINIYDNSNSQLYDGIDLSNSSDLLQIEGQGTNTIQITPYIDFSSNTNYTFEINSTTIRDISNNYYIGISYDTIEFATSDLSGLNNFILDSSSVVNTETVNGNNYYTFNNDTTYVNHQYRFQTSGSYTFTNVSSSHPIAILNNEISNNIYYSIVDNSNIVINISGGSDISNSEGDYFSFTDEDGNQINLAESGENTIFRLMRGKSYKFVNSITTDCSFILYYSDTSNTFIDSDTSFVVKIPSDHDTDLGAIYYQYKDTTNDLSNNIGLYHKNVLEDYELGNGDYDFYYGDIDISVNDVFGSVSVYCYNHGYMGGKYKLLYI